MNDLLSLRIPLLLADRQDLNGRPIPKWWGEAAHQLAIKVIASNNVLLAEELEDNNNKKMKPFTVSTLHGHFLKGKLDPDAVFSLRLTALDNRVAASFEKARSEGCLQEGATVELDFIKFQIPNKEAQIPIEIAGASYEAFKNILLSQTTPPRVVKFKFTSPTIFQDGDQQTPYPDPGLIFGNLLDHWNDVHPVAKLMEDVKSYAINNFRIGHYDLRSRVVRMFGKPFRGFMGEISFVNHKNYDRYWMGIITMLAQYAAYSGVGAKTTMGLGQCALLPEASVPASS